MNIRNREHSFLRKCFGKRFLPLTGFTLVELLLVITILGILAAMAIPRLFPQSEKARMAEALNILSAVRQGEEAYFLQKGDYIFNISSGTSPAESALWENLGMNNPNPSRYFSYRVERNRSDVDTPRMIATRINDPSGRYTGSSVRLELDGTFSCSGNYISICPR